MQVNVIVQQYPMILTIVFNIDDALPSIMEQIITVGTETYKLISAIYYGSGHFTSRYYLLNKVWELNGMNKVMIDSLGQIRHQVGCAEPIEISLPYNEAMIGVLPTSPNYGFLRKVSTVFYLKSC